MTGMLNRSYQTLLEKHGLPLGSALENAVTWRLHRAGVLDQFQYSVGPYRLDYAWPHRALKVALEVDGIYHRLPGAAERDAERDRYLRDRGWLVFRIDDGDMIAQQLARVARTINILASAERVVIGGSNAP
jgi:very-short-patch-repair endonuclease